MRKSSSGSAMKIPRADAFADKLKRVLAQTREGQDYDRGMIKYAAGFMPKHQFPGGIPKDEFHHVLKSQSSREAQRDASRHNTTGEEALVKVRVVLLASIINDYTSAQETVLAGGDPPPGALRGN